MRKFFMICMASLVTYHISHIKLMADFVDVESYEIEVSLFQRIADLEQEKILMRLEKERAQLQLDLDRLAAEQMRLFREQENADARAAEQTAEIERQKLAIEQERRRLDDQRRRMAEDAARAAEEADDARAARRAAREAEPSRTQDAAPREAVAAETIIERFFLREIVGAGTQLFATVEDIRSGRQTRLSVGRSLEGHTVRAISLDNGVEFERNGEILTLGVGMFGAADMED